MTTIFWIFLILTLVTTAALGGLVWAAIFWRKK